jgi:hypothetical protein
LGILKMQGSNPEQDQTQADAQDVRRKTFDKLKHGFHKVLLFSPSWWKDDIFHTGVWSLKGRKYYTFLKVAGKSTSRLLIQRMVMM